MTTQNKVILGVGIGALVFLVGRTLYIYNQKPKPKPKPRETKEPDIQSNAQGLAAVKADNIDYMPLLLERVYITKNRNNFRDPKTEGYNEFLKRTQDILKETEKRNLDFFITDTDYILVREQEVLALIKKEPETTEGTEAVEETEAVTTED